jgi:alkylation response protein AidB-like acyl-CoA dehydrogenase
MNQDHDTITMFRDSARSFLAAVDQRQRVRRLEDAGGGLDRAVWQQIAELGWLGVAVAEADGGLGLGDDAVHAIAAICEEAGEALLPEPLVDAGVFPLMLLAGLPEAPARDALLADLLAGTRVAGVAMQETAGDLDPAVWHTTAQDTGSGLRLTGRKLFVRPGPGADGWIVVATGSAVTTLAWVAANAPGLRTEPATGVDGSAIWALNFSDTPATWLAQGQAAATALAQATECARIALSAELLGIARRALTLTTEYLKTRQQFGRAIGSFQALQHRQVDAWMQVQLAQAALQAGLAALGSEPIALIASRVKARCGQAATEVTRLAIQLHGAIGTTNEYDVGLYFKRAMTLASRLGHTTAHRARHARLLLQTPPVGDSAAAWPHADFPRDADWAAMPEPMFRQMLRAFLARHYPEARRHLPYRQTWAQSRAWYLTLARQGWLAPGWPRERGGMGLPADKLIAYLEEFERHGVARPPDQGLVMLGPILMRFGTEAQCARFLPPILAGEHVWTQGYSEPGAGSDLAAVRTEAVVDGEYFVVTGQKTWTTWGADGTHMFMLVRTDKTVKKQAGISFLLVDLKSPGVTVRPIRNIAAEQEFCEVFFDQVRVPRENLVGELNQGWTVAKALLGFERLFTGSPKHAQYTLGQVQQLAQQRGLFDDPAFLARWATLQLDTLDLRAAYTGFAELAKRGEPLPPSISMLKVWSTETFEQLALLLIEAGADFAALRDHVRSDGIDLHLVAPLFNAIGAKIFAGSNEIQRNILARQVLGLPGE